MRNERPATVAEIAPGVRRIIAPNPSPMTFWGTNSYLIGREDVAVIDPGPDDPSHLSTLLSEIGERPVAAILVTHSHRDHSKLAPKLAKATGAPILAYGDAYAGRSHSMEPLAGSVGGGEGVDEAFRPDRRLLDGEDISGADWRISALWTPGHMGNHLCFVMGDLLFSGDLVMGWSTSLVSPPDGDLRAFMASCRRLAARSERRFLPGHGAPIEDPKARLAELIAHREARMAQIEAALAEAPGSPVDLTARVYRDLDEWLLPAAERNLLAHLIALVEEGKAKAAPALAPDAIFSAT